MGRQALSLLAGDAIDVFIASKLRAALCEAAMARALHQLRSQLWPGGTWFAFAPPPPGAPTPPPGATPPPGQFPPPITPEAWLVHDPPPDDAPALAAALQGAVRAAVPAALSGLLGRQRFEKGLGDVFELLQSATFVAQVGYSLLECVLCAVFPEMRPLVRAIHAPAAEDDAPA